MRASKSPEFRKIQQQSLLMQQQAAHFAYANYVYKQPPPKLRPNQPVNPQSFIGKRDSHFSSISQPSLSTIYPKRAVRNEEPKVFYTERVIGEVNEAEEYGGPF